MEIEQLLVDDQITITAAYIICRLHSPRPAKVGDTVAPAGQSGAAEQRQFFREPNNPPCADISTRIGISASMDHIRDLTCLAMK